MMTPKQLHACFPYMFEGKHIGIEIPHGWMPVFEKLCEEIDQVLGPNKRGFYWRQCKEKFGSARWYWKINGGRSPLRIDLISKTGAVGYVSHDEDSGNPQLSVPEKIRELIQVAEDKTHESCIVCGAAAQLDKTKGYLLVLCTKHAKQRRLGDLPQFWFDESEE